MTSSRPENMNLSLSDAFMNVFYRDDILKSEQTNLLVFSYNPTIQTYENLLKKCTHSFYKQPSFW